MKGDLTAEPNTRQDAGTARAGSSESAWRFSRLGAAGALLAALFGAALFALVAQVPARHPVDVGGYDAAYVQGFHDPERADQPGERPYLSGSDGRARWTRDISFLLFPQAGLPGEVTLLVRGRDASGTDVQVLLNGADELGRFRATDAWQEHRFRIEGGWAKPSDIVVELRTDAARLSTSDGRAVGVLLDRATYSTAGFPAAPYPAQLAYGGLAGATLYLLAATRAGGRRSRPRSAVMWWAGALLALALAYLLLYHLQPIYPYPLRRLPQAVCAVLGGMAALRFAPMAARRAPWLLDALALGGASAWLGVVLVRAQEHLVLSVPGVEKDFRVFATRAFDAAEVFRADGFYNLGYPLLLWLATPLAQGNPFVAARWVSALSGALLLLATWWIARRTAGRGAAFIALTALALSATVAQYGLYVGSDMPFAALCGLALATLVSVDGAQGRQKVALSAGAGLLAGAAFLTRHPGLLLLPVGLAGLWGLRDRSDAARPEMRPSRLMLAFALAFAVAVLPQIAVNVRDTGQPLYNQQAKNVWLAVYGDGDWGRWGETSDGVGLADVVLQDPARFLGAWWANVRAFFGTGAEDTGEFGRSTQLRLLGFPANWLAVGGLLAWATLLVRRAERFAGPTRRKAGERGTEDAIGAGRRSLLPSAAPLLLGWVTLYAAVVSVGLPLPRFFLPLAAVYAVAAGWSAMRVGDVLAPRLGAARGTLVTGLVLLPLLWGGFAAGTNYVLRDQPDAASPGQPPEVLAAARLILDTLGPADRLAVRTAPSDEEGLALAKYSAVAHLVQPDGADYLLWSTDLGPAPAGGARIGEAGRYVLIRLRP